jgi:hypothetical protein
LIVIGMLLASGVVNADLKATAEVDAWDIGASPPIFAHSQVYFPADGTWMPFLHQLNFDTDGFDWQTFPWGTYGSVTYPGGCTGTDTTPWEGVMHWGLYHQDNSPAGNGFQETRYWRLTHCDREPDGDFDNDDKRYVPAGPWIPIANAPAPEITLLRQDYLDTTQCGGNCLSEIITTIFVSVDTNCDGVLDETDYLLPGGGEKSNVCFYGEALTPKSPDNDPIWSGTPLQARISTLGAGDKTVSFQVRAAATPIELSSIEVTWVENRSQYVLLGAALGLAVIAVLGALVWRLRPVR